MSQLFRSFAPLLALAAIAGFAAPALALEPTVHGSTLVLRGLIHSGDDLAVIAAIEAARGQLRVVDLDSPGGKITPAVEIARRIRADGLVTLVDANRSNCASACTVLFAGGVRRHYVGAEGIVDAVAPKGGHGLGYHEGHTSLSPDGNRYSGAATAQMIAAYHEFGMPQAAPLATRAPPEKLWRVSSASALALGIATSTARP
ncbi:hypothetical protein EYW49_18385 [Siculibacillus lacustris]|uniref:Uncharacterized protein n=1 Tax=Siculibacillus lacustris TaxID=1549641 RepID=A0A4Q9VJ50_9HYPH|nr:hypothetical protein [Siculibacillus lacustris]TBW34407.1 hypothetical protein EYW49_18385 [Siculibacillus lacustris]